jgi:hypothetical protein
LIVEDTVESLMIRTQLRKARELHKLPSRLNAPAGSCRKNTAKNRKRDQF